MARVGIGTVRQIGAVSVEFRARDREMRLVAIQLTAACSLDPIVKEAGWRETSGTMPEERLKVVWLGLGKGVDRTFENICNRVACAQKTLDWTP